MSFPTEQDHHDAVKALLESAEAFPYDYDESIPRDETGYSLLTVVDRFGGVQRLTSQIGTRSVRIAVRAVGDTMDNVREIRARVDAALREQRLAVGGFTSTPIAFETAESPAPDGDVLRDGAWFSALSSYTYTV